MWSGACPEYSVLGIQLHNIACVLSEKLNFRLVLRKQGHRGSAKRWDGPGAAVVHRYILSRKKHLNSDGRGFVFVTRRLANLVVRVF
jgi:hypothetical protein